MSYRTWNSSTLFNVVVRQDLSVIAPNDLTGFQAISLVLSSSFREVAMYCHCIAILTHPLFALYLINLPLISLSDPIHRVTVLSLPDVYEALISK